MEEILAKARKLAEEVEVYVATAEQTNVQFEANRLKHMQTKQSTHVGLRIIKDGRIGYASTTSLVKPEELVRMAVETAQVGQKAKFEFPGDKVLPKIAIYDAKVQSVSIDDMARLGNEMIAAIRKHTPEIQCEGGVDRGVYTTSLINSRGGQASFKTSVFSMGIEGNLVRGTDMLFVGESESDCHPILKSKQISDTVIKQLDMAKEIASVPN